VGSRVSSITIILRPCQALLALGDRGTSSSPGNLRGAQM
jgi:hypothetical protein